MSKFLVLALVLGFSVSVSGSTTLKALSLGGNDLDVTDPAVMEIVRYGVQEYNKRSKDHIYVLKKIEEGSQSVTPWGCYFIGIVLVETKCKKPVKKNKLCLPGPDAAEKKVGMKVVTNLLGKDELTEEIEFW